MFLELIAGTVSSESIQFIVTILVYLMFYPDHRDMEDS
jgi:hypothetical protein